MRLIPETRGVWVVPIVRVPAFDALVSTLMNTATTSGSTGGGTDIRTLVSFRDRSRTENEVSSHPVPPAPITNSVVKAMSDSCDLVPAGVGVQVRADDEIPYPRLCVDLGRRSGQRSAVPPPRRRSNTHTRLQRGERRLRGSGYRLRSEERRVGNEGREQRRDT